MMVSPPFPNGLFKTIVADPTHHREVEVNVMPEVRNELDVQRMMDLFNVVRTRQVDELLNSIARLLRERKRGDKEFYGQVELVFNRWRQAHAASVVEERMALQHFLERVR